MEKAILTQKQIKAIEDLRELGVNNEKIIKYNVSELLEIDRGTYADTIKKIDFEELIKALYKGYEAKQKFNKGDWVFDFKNNEIAKVRYYDVNEKRVWIEHCNLPFFFIEETRHARLEEIAEEEKRRWWASHGREVWELKRNDVLIDEEGKTFIIDKFFSSGNDQRVLFKNDSLEYMNNIKELYKVLCFAEDRKDF